MPPRPLLALTVVLLLAGCGSTSTTTVTRPLPTSASSAAASGASNSSTTTSTPAASPPAPVLFQGVAGGGAQRPSTLQLTADGTLSVSGVQWTSWGGPTATGSGSAQYHGCTPNCAQAQVQTALVSIRLSGIRVCGGRRYYAGLTLTLPSGQPLDQQFVQRSWSPC